MSNNLFFMVCSNPECNNLFFITQDQKRELKTYFYKKYGKSPDPYCSFACLNEHLKELSESEFAQKGTLKNHTCALIIQGCDVSKRPKEKEIRIITGRTTEQQARCLLLELISLVPVQNQKTMSSKNVQDYLLEKLPVDIKPSKNDIDVTAWRVMNKCKQLFPNVVEIGRINGKDRYIEYIG